MNIVNDNIKALRVMFGETQEELGEVLGVTKQCISNYEHGSRDSSFEDLVSIANHYHIPIERLMEQQIEVSDESDEFVINKKFAQRLFNAQYPLFFSIKAEQDPHFHKAFCFSKQIYDSLERFENPMYTMVDLCWKHYKISWKRSQTIESLANLLSLIFISCSSNLNNDEIKLGEAFLNKKSIDNDFLKKFYLRDRHIETANESKNLFVQEYYEEVMEYITVLKKNEKWSELGDYYLALRYIVGLIDNGRGVDANLLFGYELMDTLFEIENPYAIDYITVTLGYYHPQKEGKRNVYNMD